MKQVVARRHRRRSRGSGWFGRRRRVNTRAPIGRDFADSQIRSANRLWWAALLVAGMLTALLLVHVRVRLIDEGYQRAAALERVEALMARRQVLRAETGALRDRNRLMTLALERGFDKPQQEIWLAARSELRP